MTENEITYKIIGCVYKVYNALGPGLLESAYQKALSYEIRKQGLNVEEQVHIPLEYDGQPLGDGYIADIIVENRVILELKSVIELKKVFYKQLLTYLRLKHLRVGLLINFKEDNIKEGIHRIVNGY